MKTALYLLAAALLQAGPASASEGGTTALPFLSLQQGARPTGMAGAFTALADDINALWWNPAGMARSKMTEVAVSHTAFVEDVTTEYFAVSRPVPALKGGLGGSLTYMTVPGIEGFDANGVSAGQLTANSYAASLGYAAFLVPGQLSMGVAGKYVGQTLTTEKGTGMAVDFGLQGRQDKLSAGVSVQNVGPSFKIGNDSTPLPTTVRAGVGYEPNSRVLAAFDFSKARDGGVLPHLGGEVKLTQNFQLRAGWQRQENLGSGAGLSFGFTLLGALGGGASAGGSSDWGGEGTPWWDKANAQIPKTIAAFDYSFTSLGSLSDVHRLSLSLKF